MSAPVPAARGCDVIVAGLGAMGSAAVYHLAKRGLQVLGLDRFAPPHQRGSTHGRTRIIREAYYEHPLYVPLVQRAFQLWEELEADAEEPLFVRTGGLMIGPPDGVLVSGARRSALEHELPHEELSADEIRRRFPVIQPRDEWVGLLEPRAGMLLPEECVTTHLDLAERHGALLRPGEPMLGWRTEGGGVRVSTPTGDWEADRLVLTLGPWLPELLGDLRLPLQVERQTFHWVEPRGDRDAFGAERCPIALWEYEPDRLFATFSDIGHGVKFGVHHEGEITDPERVRRTTSEEEDAHAAALLKTVMPDAVGRLRETRVCLYTNTPDHDFLIDRHPEHAQVIIASPCSGHGFKFASAIGEVIAELVVDGASRFDLSPFGIQRLIR